VRLSSAGSVNLTAEGGTELAYVRAANGSINVTSHGDLTASDVAALGISDANDIVLTTVDPDNGWALSANLACGEVESRNRKRLRGLCRLRLRKKREQRKTGKDHFLGPANPVAGLRMVWRDACA